ncbi:MAG TPA: ATP-grasp domain-containing protein [Blastocatellia bacterium]|nr:ATP-grasp domain-containing protein [Blastocatellia bacterium]
MLLPTTTYRTKAFLDAALKLGVEVTAASERPSTLADKNPAGLLTLSFLDPERACRQAVEFARDYPVDAIIPVDEDTAVTAAYVARALGLKHNPVGSALAAKNKHRMREILESAGVPVPRFWHFTLDMDRRDMAAQVTYPCVVKPVFLSTSRGVMRADEPAQFLASVRRLESILASPEIAGRGGAASREVLVEQFVPGVEVAVEALLTNSNFRMLAIFDKPDPLDGPFFEETIYVTPSRLPVAAQDSIAQTTAAAARAMGLVHGAIHAELRLNEAGPWVIEVAARAIGGLCSRALSFGVGVSLEEVILRNALGQDVDSFEREQMASGVMMIPIPAAGILREIRGVDEARSLPYVEDIAITAHISQRIAPPPEGASYLGFIFSHAPAPEEVENALREAHRHLEFIIEREGDGIGR